LNKSLLLRFFATLGGLGIYVLPFLVGLVLVYFWFHHNLLAPVSKGSTETIVFQVQAGWDLDKISKELHTSGLTNTSWAVSFLGSLRENDSNKLGAIVAGEYSLSPALTPGEILDSLQQGSTVEYPLTIPVGTTVSETAKLIAEANLASEPEALLGLRDHDTMVRLGIPAYIPEGYIMPGTYSFSKPVKPQQISAKILSASMEYLDDQLNDWKALASALGFNPYEILTLASLLERQTADSAARKVISSILHNRLRIGMELESVPSLRYVLPEDQEKITREDILAPGPYNLFQNVGLPPTPICSPSIDAINAALYPDDTDFLYFMKDAEDGYHYSETGSEHRKKLEEFGRIPKKTTNEPAGLSQLE
jgi:UPF0755 protein